MFYCSEVNGSVTQCYMCEQFSPLLWVLVFVMFPTAGILYAIIEPVNHVDFVVHGKPRALLPTFVEIHKHICACGGYYELYFRDILRQPESGKVDPGENTPEILQQKIVDIRVRKRELIKKLAMEGADIVVTSTYLAFCTFTGSAAWRPCTWRGRAFTSMWTMWCVIVIAAYTVREAYKNTHTHTHTHIHTKHTKHTHTERERERKREIERERERKRDRERERERERERKREREMRMCSSKHTSK